MKRAVNSLGALILCVAFSFVLVTGVQSSAAEVEEDKGYMEEVETISDPFEKFNRAM